MQSQSLFLYWTYSQAAAATTAAIHVNIVNLSSCKLKKIIHHIAHYHHITSQIDGCSIVIIEIPITDGLKKYTQSPYVFHLQQLFFFFFAISMDLIRKRVVYLFIVFLKLRRINFFSAHIFFTHRRMLFIHISIC